MTAWRIDKGRPTPAYLQLSELVRGAIEAGDLPVGAALPSERELAASLGLARMTVRRAVEALVEEGLLVRRHGSGTYVRRPSVEQTFDRVLGFSDEARKLGFEAGTDLLEAGRRRAGADVATRLRIAPDASVLMLRRLRTADREPLAIQTAYLAPPYAGLSLDLLRHNESLYRTLREQFGIAPHHARQTVSARLPDGREQHRLGLEPGVPVLALERVTFDARERPFEVVRSAYRGDRYRLALELGAPETPGAQGPGAEPAAGAPDDGDRAAAADEEGFR